MKRIERIFNLLGYEIIIKPRGAKRALNQGVSPRQPVGVERMLDEVTEADLRGYKDPAGAAAKLREHRRLRGKRK